MKTLLLALAVLVLAVPAASAAEPGILYSADARGATIVKSGKAVRLSVPAGTRTTWFTDRPARKAGSTTMGGLVAIWDASGFREDPPNAALLLTHKGETRTHVVTLTDPRHERGRVSFRLREIPSGVEAGHRHTHAIAAGRYGRAELFIDDAAYPPCPSVSVSSFTSCLLATAQPVIISTFPPWVLPTITVKACAFGAKPGTIFVSADGSANVAEAPPCPLFSMPIQVGADDRPVEPGTASSLVMVAKPPDSPPLVVDIK